RRQRISKGCGLPVSQINSLIKRYEETKKLMKQINASPKKFSRMFRGR
ncbi:MAG: signal recognition particle protein, partial [Firmicutes bacterium]|nr:signal recognition particle protein [Bacillota bacterium]